MNVADDYTKLKENLDMSQHSRWLNGPEFLRESEDKWPPIPSSLAYTEEEEVRAINVHRLCIRGNASPNPNNTSTWSILLRSQARVLRYLSKQVRDGRGLSDEIFTPDELHKAELELLRTCQRDCYSEEISMLEAGGEILQSNLNRLRELNPFINPDEGLIRLRTRIQKARVFYDTRNPILLPKGHRMTRLILDHYHRQLHHQYHETVVNEVRQKFYVPHLRVEVKKVITDCQKCKNDRAKPQAPQMGNIPPARLAQGEPPFSYVGIDYFGPIELAVGRARKKYWGVLITCLTTRAVNLDMTSSLTSDHAVMVMQRFVSRRGEPKEVWCDNATTFRGVASELDVEQAMADWRKAAKEYAQIEWKFIPPAAPHMGGSWERMIRSVKCTLKAILKTRTPTPEVFRTALSEIENILNSRPLTYVSTDPQCEEALTPNHILLGRSNKTQPIGPLPNHKTSTFTKKWQRALDISTQFWIRWVKEYLPTLARRTKWFAKVNPIEVGDVGIIWDSGTKNSWKLGRVVNVAKAKDGQVRILEIKTAKGYYKRPASKFAKLDVGEPETSSTAHEGGNVGEAVLRPQLTPISTDDEPNTDSPIRTDTRAN